MVRVDGGDPSVELGVSMGSHTIFLLLSGIIRLDLLSVM